MIRDDEMTNADQLTLPLVVLITARWFALDELSLLITGMVLLLMAIRLRLRHRQPAFALGLLAMEPVAVFDLFILVWNCFVYLWLWD